jgi:glucokinase
MVMISGTCLLGIDIGGSKILTAVTNPSGEIISSDYTITPAQEDVGKIIDELIASIHRSVDGAKLKMEDIAAIGIGAPGISNPDSGIVYSSPNLPSWRNVPLKQILKNRLKRPAFLINDANAAALGEFYYGAAREVMHFIYVTISTGIGGGIVINGDIYTGTLGTAGEIGHMIIEHDGPLCGCGNRGCWETLASGTALAREAKQRIEGGVTTSIMETVGGRIEEITAEVVHAAADQGDATAKELIAQTSYYLGIGLTNLVNIFNPKLIVIGGGLSNIGDSLLQPAYDVVRERAFREAYDAVGFARAKLGRNSGVLGAAAFAFHELK